MENGRKSYARKGRGDRKRTRLGLLANMYADLERLRVAQETRQSHLKLDRNPLADDPLFSATHRHLKAAQDEVDRALKTLVRTHPAWTGFGLHVKGCGEHLMGLILGEIRDITPFVTVSKLWYLCGLAVINGKAQRPRKGEVLNYNARLKMLLLGRLGAQLLKNGDPFARARYDAFKAREQARITVCYDCDGRTTDDAGKPCTPCNGTGEVSGVGAHRRALRKVIKLWVACLWLTWRQAEGLPTGQSYAARYLQGRTADGLSVQVHDEIGPQDWIAFNAAAK